MTFRNGNKMKKVRNLAIIVLMITILMILSIKVEATTGEINSETVRLRKEPNSKSTILDQLDKGDKVEILDQKDGWYKIKAETEQGNVTGYISEKLIDVEKGKIPTDTTVNEEKNTTAEETNTLVEETTNVDESKDLMETSIESQENSEKLQTEGMTEKIEENKEYIVEQEIIIKALPLMNSREKAKTSGKIEVIEIINDWSRIENDTECGWIRTNTLKQVLKQVDIPAQEQQPETELKEPIITEPEISKQEPEQKPNKEGTVANKTGYVTAEGLRVRKEPDSSSEELDSLKRNDKVEIIGQTGNWYKIKLNGEIGYVSSKYISDTKVPETTSRSGSSLKKEETLAGQNQETNEAKPEEISEESKSTGAEVVEYAKKYLGYKYVSGGSSPEKGFDCSGFTLYVYKHFGITLNRSSGAQIKNGIAVEKSDLQLGDIVLFNNDANTSIGHVGIYIGNGNFIHASNPKDGVKITTLTTGYYEKRYVGARRVI